MLVNYEDYTEMHGQQNIKILLFSCFKCKILHIHKNLPVDVLHSIHFILKYA